MRGACEQFYRTWCYAGRSVSGADGWKIRAKSAGLPLPEAEGMADLANYWVPTRSKAGAPPGTRLALFRPSPAQAVLVHGVLRPGLVGGRAGVSFEHVLARLPPAFSAFEAIRFWHSAAWQVDDGDFGPVLGPFVWQEQTLGREFQSGPHEAGTASSEDVSPGWDDALAGRLLEQYPGLPWSHALQACLGLCQRQIEKLFVAGPDEAVARLLYVVFYCLPEAFRKQLTFSTHENPRGTKGVKIVGVTTFEGEDDDLPAFCYEGQYRALNLFTGIRSDELELGPFAAQAIDWLRCGQYAYVRRTRAEFDRLNAADAPGVLELDLLSQEQSRGLDATAIVESLPALCASRAIARARIARPEALAAILAAADANEEFQAKLAAAWSSWVAGDAAASEQLIIALVAISRAEMERSAPWETVQRQGQFAQRIAAEVADHYHEKLFAACQEVAEPPPLSTRLRLLETWLALPALSGMEPDQAPANWIPARPSELGPMLESTLPLPFKQRAIATCLNGTEPITSTLAETLASVICADAVLTRELFFDLPCWRQQAGTAAAALPESVVARIIEAFSQSLTLAAALRDEAPRLLGSLELWEAQRPTELPGRLRTMLALGQYLRQPASRISFEGEILSRAFWWAEGGKEAAVNAALDRLLSVGTIEDFERAIDWFGHGAWTLSPQDLVLLASHRLAAPGFPIKGMDPILRDGIELLACALKEWDQTRNTPLGAAPSPADKPLGLGAKSISFLSHVALRHFPDGAFFKSPTARSLVALFKKENHLLEGGLKERFHKLAAVVEAAGAKEPTAETLLTLAQSALDDALDPALRHDLQRRFETEAAGHPKLLRPFLRKFFDATTELCTQRFLPAFMDYLAEREPKVRDSRLSEEFALALHDLGDELAAREPGIVEALSHFLKRLPPKSRERFEHLLKQGDGTKPKAAGSPSALLPRSGGAPAVFRPLRDLKPSARARGLTRIIRALGSEPALHIYFYVVVVATVVLAIRYRHPIAHFFHQVFNP